MSYNGDMARSGTEVQVWATRLRILTILAVLLVGIVLLAANVVQHLHMASQYLRAEVFVSTVHDEPEQTVALVHAAGIAGLTVTDVSQPDGLKTAGSLFPSGFQTPLVHARRKDNPEVIVGYDNVSRFLEDAVNRRTPARTAAKSIGVMLLFGAIALTIRGVVAFLGGWGAVVGGAAMTVSMPLCKSCSDLGATTVLFDQLPTAAVLVFAAIACCLASSKTRKPAMLAFAMLLSLSVILTQFALVSLVPKVCATCILASAAAWVSLVCSSEHLARRGRAPAFVLPVGWLIVLVCAIPYTGMQRWSAYLFKYKQVEAQTASLSGMSVADVLPGVPLSMGDLVLIESLRDCDACEAAKAALTAARVSAIIVKPCSVLQKTGCMKREFYSVSPVLFTIGAEGRIENVEIGWPLDREKGRVLADDMAKKVKFIERGRKGQGDNQ